MNNLEIDDIGKVDCIVEMREEQYMLGLLAYGLEIGEVSSICDLPIERVMELENELNQ